MADYSVVLVGRAPAQAAPPTFTELGPLVPTSFSYSDSLNVAGTFEGTTDVNALNDDIKQRLRDPLNYPSEVWVFAAQPRLRSKRKSSRWSTSSARACPRPI